MSELSNNNFLEDLLDLAQDPSRLDEAIGVALDELARLVPYDLAAWFDWLPESGHLKARVLRGRLAPAARLDVELDPARLPSIERAFRAGHPWALSAKEHDEEGDPWDGVLDLAVGHSCMLLPVVAGGERMGIITLDREQCGVYEDPALQVAGLTSRVLAQAARIARQAARLQELGARLEERARMREGTPAGTATARLEAARAPEMVALRETARRVAASSAPVLIGGETGTGKEGLARAIHEWSPRHAGPFLAVNCAALPAPLAESELFGHLRGAFTGAVRDRPGLFAAADGGTLLLDEVGELPLDVQAKLLRVLQEGQVTAVGAEKPRAVDVRLVAASHLDLAEAVRQGRFRQDLFFRLHVVPLVLPPLRRRLEDLDALADSILAELGQGRAILRLEEPARQWLKRQSWPGNIRQLRNALERAAILSPDGRIGTDLLRDDPPSPATPATLPAVDEVVTLEEWERRYIRHVVELCAGRVHGPHGAALRLGMKPTTLQSRMRKLGLKG